jgi:hypothetical protein
MGVSERRKPTGEIGVVSITPAKRENHFNAVRFPTSKPENRASDSRGFEKREESSGGEFIATHIILLSGSPPNTYDWAARFLEQGRVGSIRC